MDFKQLEYILAIEEYGNISRAAAALFISQSALNQQLIHLEKELNMKLFARDNRNLWPTQAGKIYLENAKEILKIKKNTYSLLQDLSDSTIGELRLGLTWEHGIDMFTAIFPAFNQRFPRFTFRLFERNVAQQHQMLSGGHLDMGFVMLQDTERIDASYVELCHEELILGIPSGHPLAGQAAGSGEPLTRISLSLFKDDLFSLIFPESTMRAVINPLFRAAGYSPRILFETSMNHALQKMVSRGLCCTILPESYAVRDGSVAWFRLEGNVTWTWCLVYPKGVKLNAASQHFIHLARQYGVALEKDFSSMQSL
ncbi:MAG: LysR family transcriptional regulator [Eubacteriales bacterium]|nr:LysR family transcriptional regulator [Eubacteriales bacterium]